jgi:hypothetical protein
MVQQFGSDLQKDIYYQFEKTLKNFKELQLEHSDLWIESGYSRTFDIVIYKGNHARALVEIKSTLNQNTLVQAKNSVLSGLEITNARFGIITDGVIFHLFDRNKFQSDFIEVTYSNLIEKIQFPGLVIISEELKIKIQSIFIQASAIFLNNSEALKELVMSSSFFTYLDFDNDINQFYFNDKEKGKSSFENKIFLALMGKFNERKICRYTSLESLFSTLNNISFRMNGLVAMNDISEVDYVDNYLNKFNRPFNRLHHTSVMAINKRYISSCSTLKNKDNLTMWRLYASDSSGVCLTFSINNKNLGNNTFIHKVKYADLKGKHNELEYLKMIIDQVKQLTGFAFKFRNLGYWKHFFKPKEYEIEDEVRLLVIDDANLKSIKNDWVMTNSHSIFNPVIDFRLNDRLFPLQLREIMLGPKCPEKENNKVQIEELIRRKKREIIVEKMNSNLNNLKVEISQINHYR